MNYYSDEPEWKWLFNNAIDWDTILPLYYPSYPTEDGFESADEVKQFFEEILSSTGEWSANSVWEIAKELDEKGHGEVKDGMTHPGPALQRLIKEAKELELFGLPIARKYGGMETPYSLYLLILNQISRSCVSSSTLIAFYVSIADMIQKFLTDDEAKASKLLEQIIAGELSGSMNLTEAGAGSDLSAIKTSAAPQDDGTYLLNGEKIFITNGGGGLAFVLAKIKGAPDTLDGISMFFVEQKLSGKEGLNFRVEKAEEKMGMHGSFTTVVSYDNTIAQLVGEAGKGFNYMLHLMNEARICVGIQALGGLEGALGYARNYAKERMAFGKPIEELPLLKRNLEDFETERDGIRALLVDTSSWFDIFNRLEIKHEKTGDLNDEEKKLHKKAKKITRKRTPLVKYYSTEAYTHLSQRAIQVLGGYGFIKEYPVERIHRDSFGPLLYEGTSQIQALMTLKDTLKEIMKNPKSFFGSMLGGHPSASRIKRENAWDITYNSLEYTFRKKLVALIFNELRPDDFTHLLNIKEWTSEEKVNRVSIHAETICQAISYLETLDVLKQHANKDESRVALFWRYRTLIEPRLKAIYTDWALRS
jgi:3-(methylthio)propanoyl-CoA dehydrogenase